MRLTAFLRELVVWGLLASAVLVLLSLWWWWTGTPVRWDGRIAALSSAAILVLAAVAAGVRRRPLRQVAEVIDRLGGTADRFLTALHLSEDRAQAGLSEAALRECRAYAARRDFRSLIKVRIPREVAWILVPAVSCVLLQWDVRLRAEARSVEVQAARDEVADTAARLEQLARETEQRNEQTPSEELKRMAEQLKRSAGELRANPTNREEAEKAALAQLSLLEALVKEMQQAPAPIAAEEMKELAKALEKSEATKEAAAAMQAGNLDEAARKLEEAAQKNEPGAEEAQAALKEAMQRLAEKRALSDALQKLAQELERRGGQAQQPQGNNALQRLAQILKQMQQGKGGQQQQQSGSQSTQQALQNVLAALQNMKFGEGEPQGPGQEAKGGQANSTVTMQSFGEQGSQGEPGAGQAQAPSGQAGEDNDLGTTATPFGERRDPEGATSADLALRGRLAEGESLSALLPSAGDTSRTSRRYKELYEAMAPAAQAAVEQENIPLGSRFFIKRYFESIRPSE